MVRSWSELSNDYGKWLAKPRAQDFPALSSMEKLVRAIEYSPYASGLFAWTSHFGLCIAQTAVEYPYYGPRLMITPLKDDQIEFRYVDTRVKAKQWRRTVGGGDAFHRLESVIEQLCWFVRYEANSKKER